MQNAAAHNAFQAKRPLGPCVVSKVEGRGELRYDANQLTCVAALGARGAAEFFAILKAVC